MEDSIYRAFKLWEKMMDDGECPLFVYAVATTFEVLAASAVANVIDDEYGSDTIVKRLFNEVAQDELEQKIIKQLRKEFMAKGYDKKSQDAWHKAKRKQKHNDDLKGT
jgi:hypothetical protein